MRRIAGAVLIVSVLFAALSISAMAAGDTSPEGHGIRVTEFNDVRSAIAEVGEPQYLDGAQVPSESFRKLGIGLWHDSGFKGGGARIGVIDSGFGRLDELIEAMGLPPVPAERRVNHCDAGFERTEHGTATVEVLYDLAPEAELWLLCIDDTVDLGLAVDNVIDADIDIVNMSLGFYNTGRGDGSGAPDSPDASILRAIDNGIVWVNAAGNEAELHYGGLFTDRDGDGRHEFAGADEQAEFLLPAGRSADILLKWDAWPVTDQDFSICAGPVGGPLLCDAASPAGERQPTAFVSVFNGLDADAIYRIVIRGSGGSIAPRLDMILLGGRDLEYPVAAGSLGEPASTPGVLTVGAICSADLTRRPFSSQGLTADGRNGVDLLAPESVSSTIYGLAAGCGSGFTGTSAAAPHVSAALALLASSGPGRTGVQLKADLLARVAAGRDLATGPDPASGHGHLALGLPPEGPVNIAEIDHGFTTPGLDHNGPNSDAAQPLTGGAGTLMTSDRPDRSEAQPFPRSAVSGAVRVFLEPARSPEQIESVRFSIDGILVSVETDPGYDLGAGDAAISYGFDTTRLADGDHLLEATVHLVDGSISSVSTTFHVDNPDGAPGPASADRDRLVIVGGLDRLVDGQIVTGELDVSLLISEAATVPVDHVLFYLDARLVQFDDRVPYQLGVVDGGVAVPFDLSSIGPGQHVLTAFIYDIDGGSRVVSGAFTVQ